MASIPRENPAPGGAIQGPAPGPGLKPMEMPILAHGVSFVLPVANLVFLASGPHAWDVALTWTLPVWLCIYADLKSPKNRREPSTSVPAWPFNAALYLLFVLQVANILLLLEMASLLKWSSPLDFATAAANIASMRIMTGTNSCCSGIAVAHELIHRRPLHQRLMGRILLWTVCYDHFVVEHLCGHHRRASQAEDPATARFGESYRDFWSRTWKQQFFSAWKLENQRLNASFGQGVLWRHRVLHGLVIQTTLLLFITAWFGPVSLLMFLYQALVAVHLLEAVNYFQHWGLTRADRRFSGTDAWITDSSFTLHAFVGLSRHADHHAQSSKPFQQLSFRDESPRLPHGYFVMTILVKLFNPRFRRLAELELRERNLGPFRPPNVERHV